jgi:hypothetical protein
MRQRCWLAFFFALTTMSLRAAEDKPSDLKVEASALRVVAPYTNADEALNAFGSRTPGTTVTLLISSPSDRIVHFEHAASAVTKFTDDKGNDLLARAAGPVPPNGEKIVPQGFSLFPLLSKDGKACALEVSAPLLPAKGSAAVKLAGTLTMLCASATKEIIQKDVAVKNGSKIETPTMKLTFEHIGKPDVGDEPLSITLRSHNNLDDVADVQFYKADGTLIRSRSIGGISKMAVLGELTVEWCFNLAENVDAVTLKLNMWSDVQKKKVDFDLTIGPGL